MNSALIQKYNVPGPRYTSYPTVPFWDEASFSKEKWIESFQKSFIESNNKDGISLYIHLPFCESLCTFCACHKHITKRHSVEDGYVDAVLKEWQLYLDLLPQTPILKEIHLGGGTPTFFSSDSLSRLIKGLLNKASLHEAYEFSFEGHPNNTTKEQLKTLFDLGFRRVSFGIQDYDPTVQKAIHRIQTFEQVKKVTEWSRSIGYTSISHDLIYGLPFQNIDTITNSINKTKELRPDRISFYSYAHVPWIKGVGQRGFNENDLPKGNEKRALYERGKQLFSDMGYAEIGMDHFALKRDSLYIASVEKSLHRNFMGYTTNTTQLMIGLGMSAISDSWYGFAQNVKTVKEYEKMVNADELPVFRGHILNNEDLIIRKHILNIMCHLKTSWKNKKLQFKELNDVLNTLEELKNDGLISIKNNSLFASEDAKPFIRNICMGFDLRMKQQQPKTQLFSMTI
ncbi:MAG: oxygen-independent coproporphyrinogen III oxidase [Gelidibacter sp.]